MKQGKTAENKLQTRNVGIVEKITESKKGGIVVLGMVLLFWLVLLAALPAMAAEKTCMVSIPVSVTLTGTASDSQDQKNPVFTVVMESTDGRNGIPMPEQNQIQIGANGSGTFDSILYTTPGDYTYQIRQIGGENSDLTYDTTIYQVTVRVLNAEDGGLEAEVWGQKAGMTEKQSQITFENQWKETKTPGTIENPIRTGKTSTTVMTKTPKTEDVQNPAVYIVTIIIAVGVAISVSLYRKYRKKEDM